MNQTLSFTVQPHTCHNKQNECITLQCPETRRGVTHLACSGSQTARRQSRLLADPSSSVYPTSGPARIPFSIVRLHFVSKHTGKPTLHSIYSVWVVKGTCRPYIMSVAGGCERVFDAGARKQSAAAARSASVSLLGCSSKLDQALQTF